MQSSLLCFSGAIEPAKHTDCRKRSSRSDSFAEGLEPDCCLSQPNAFSLLAVSPRGLSEMLQQASQSPFEGPALGLLCWALVVAFCSI